MKDHYPRQPNIPPGWLVEPAGQPDFVVPADWDLPAEFDLAGMLVDRHVAAGRGDRAAFIEADRRRTWTYRDLQVASLRFAGVLADLGVEPGDRVALRTPNVTEAVVAWLATWRLGAVVALTPPHARRAEIPFFIDDTRAKVLIVANQTPYIEETLACRDQLASVEHVIAFPDARGTPFLSWAELEAGRDAAEVGRWSVPTDSPAIVWHTGGTTGIPKACYHTVRRVIFGGEAGTRAYGVVADDIHLFPAPLGHAAGWLSRSTHSLYRGITTIEVENFSDPRTVLRAIEEYRVTWMIALATSWVAMLRAHEEDGARTDLSSLRRAYAPFLTGIGPWLHDAWEKHGVRLLNPMGSTAFASWFMMPPPGEDVPAMSVGRPSPGFEVRVVVPDCDPLRDVEPGQYGQLALRGPTGLTYWNRPERQARDVREGWTLIDDLARRDADGWFWYMGRTDLMVTVSGFKVAPVEVESLLAEHPSVAEVAVTAAPDPERGEVVMAWVVPADGVDPTQELALELQHLVKDAVAPYKTPRRIQFMRCLPHDPIGKPVVKVLCAWARGEGEAADTYPVSIP